MKSPSSLLRYFAVALAIALSASPAFAGSCQGKTMNPITDICWSCMFPISIGPVPIITTGQEDIENAVSPICSCGAFPYGKIGLTIGFWEPVRQVDVTKTAWCFPTLNGLDLSSATPAPMPSATNSQKDNRKKPVTFYQAHWFVNPIMFALKVIAETDCLETASLDIAYVTELDPIWNNDELSMILNPDVFLFANPIAQAACAADCVAATVNFPIQAMQWCAGCQGSMYPLNGHVQNHLGGVQAASLILQRFILKMHRQFITMSTHTASGLCGAYPAPILDKRSYKYTMTYPIPQTSGGVGSRCCQPLGRTTQLWEAGREYPIAGEDYSFMLFRKRNCCQRVIGLQK